MELTEQGYIERLSGIDGNFARSLCDQYSARGALSPKQWAWVRKLVGERQAQASLKVETDAAMFELLLPVQRIATIMGSGEKLQIKAPRNGKPVLYVTVDGEYIGKLDEFGGRVLAKDVQQQRQVTVALEDIVSSPLEVAKEYGRETGTCCVCSRTLTDPNSIEAGIGPICATRF